MKTAAVLSALALFAVATSLRAEEPGPYRYVGVDYARLTYGSDGYRDANPTALIGRFGVYEQTHWGVEARVGFSAGGDDLVTRDGTETGVDIDLNRMYGLYGVVRWPVSRLDLYAVAGMTHLSLQARNGARQKDSDDSGISGGAGVTLHLTRQLELRAEYVSLYREADVTVTAAAVGAAWKF